MCVCLCLHYFRFWVDSVPGIAWNLPNVFAPRIKWTSYTFPFQCLLLFITLFLFLASSFLCCTLCVIPSAIVTYFFALFSFYALLSYLISTFFVPCQFSGKPLVEKLYFKLYPHIGFELS